MNISVEFLILKAFELGDKEKKGYLHREDLKVAMLFLFGYKPSKYEVNQLMHCDPHNDNSMQIMTFPTFQSIMLSKCKSEDDDQKIRELFCILDVKCQGFLTLEDIQLAFKSVAPNISSSNILSCYKEMCKSGDAKLSYREFEHVFKSLKLIDVA